LRAGWPSELRSHRTDLLSMTLTSFPRFLSWTFFRLVIEASPTNLQGLLLHVVHTLPEILILDNLSTWSFKPGRVRTSSSGNTSLYEIDFVNLRRRFRLGRPSCPGPVKMASSTLSRSIGDAWGNALRCSVFSRPPGQNWRIWRYNIVDLVLVGLNLTGGRYGMLLEGI